MKNYTRLDEIDTFLAEGNDPDELIIETTETEPKWDGMYEKEYWEDTPYGYLNER